MECLEHMAGASGSRRGWASGRGSRGTWSVRGGSASRRLVVGLRICSRIRNWGLANRQKCRSSKGKQRADQAFRRSKTEPRMKPLNEDAIQWVQGIFPMIFDCKSEGRGAVKANTR